MVLGGGQEGEVVSAVGDGGADQCQAVPRELNLVLITVAVVKIGGVNGCFTYAVKWWLPEQFSE